MAGNANSGRRAEKPFRDALRMELAAAGEDSRALRKIAKALIAAAEDGKMDAIREVADRIDGKVAQAIEGRLEHAADDTIMGLMERIASNGRSIHDKP